MKPVQNVQSMKPVQYAQVSYMYFAHFSSLFLFNFEMNGYFHMFFLFIYLFIYFFFLEGGMGVSVEVILEDLISEIVLTE